MTAISPTPAGEGKNHYDSGLGDALIGKRAARAADGLPVRPQCHHRCGLQGRRSPGSGDSRSAAFAVHAEDGSEGEITFGDLRSDAAVEFPPEPPSRLFPSSWTCASASSPPRPLPRAPYYRAGSPRTSNGAEPCRRGQACRTSGKRDAGPLPGTADAHDECGETSMSFRMASCYEPRERFMIAASGTTRHNLKSAALARSSTVARAHRSRRWLATSMRRHATTPAH